MSLSISQKKTWLKQNSYQRHVLNCDNKRWYSKRLVWPIHASWHFCDHRLISHYFMTFFFNLISFPKCHRHHHDKFRLKQNHVSVTSSTVMIRGETQTVVSTITCLMTLCATNSCSVTLSRHFLSVIIAMVMADIWCLRVVPRNIISIFLARFDSTDNQTRQNEKACSFCSLGPHGKYIPRMSWLSPITWCSWHFAALHIAFIRHGSSMFEKTQISAYWWNVKLILKNHRKFKQTQYFSKQKQNNPFLRGDQPHCATATHPIKYIDSGAVNRFPPSSPRYPCRSTTFASFAILPDGQAAWSPVATLW